MNPFLSLSIEYANQRAYLDDLFKVYRLAPEGIRTLNSDKWKEVKTAFETHDNAALLRSLLDLELFPIKDSYIAYLRRDKSAIAKNPCTVNRICGRLYEMGLKELKVRCEEPKETNRQIGPLFKTWVKKGSLGVFPVPVDEFIQTRENAILDGTDEELKNFAKEYLNYRHDKGLDLVARFNGKYVIGEAKFLTDFGGHQNAQFNDAIATLMSKDVEAIKVAILDGVLYIPGNNKMHTLITHDYADKNIMSALLLRDFLYSI